MGLFGAIALILAILGIVFVIFGVVPWMIEGGARSIFDVFMSNFGYESTEGSNWWADVFAGIAAWWEDVTSNVAGGFR